jgi:hypothetical protein
MRCKVLSFFRALRYLTSSNIGGYKSIRALLLSLLLFIKQSNNKLVLCLTILTLTFAKVFA